MQNPEAVCPLCAATGVDWLTQKYKLYLMLRERLLMDTPLLRGSISKARTGPESLNDPAYRPRGVPPLPNH